MSTHKSFTLIELLVVIAIIGVLSAIVITSMSNAVTKSRIAKLQVFSDTIRAQLSDSLVSWWSFNEGSGTDAKDMWEGNDGTLTNFDGDTGWKSGGDCISGSCLEFDGVDDYVNCGNDDSLNITDAITIEAWIYWKVPHDVGQYDGIVWKKSNNDPSQAATYALALYNDEKFRLRIFGSGGNGIFLISNTQVSLNSWQHLIGTYDISTGTVLYRNGVIDKTDSTTIGQIEINSNPVWIGKHHSTSRFFDGLIDEVRIYNSAATITQIQSQYLAGLDKLLSNGAISKTEYNQRIKELSKEIVIE